MEGHDRSIDGIVVDSILAGEQPAWSILRPWLSKELIGADNADALYLASVVLERCSDSEIVQITCSPEGTSVIKGVESIPHVDTRGTVVSIVGHLVLRTWMLLQNEGFDLEECFRLESTIGARRMKEDFTDTSVDFMRYVARNAVRSVSPEWSNQCIETYCGVVSSALSYYCTPIDNALSEWSESLIGSDESYWDLPSAKKVLQARSHALAPLIRPALAIMFEDPYLLPLQRCSGRASNPSWDPRNVFSSIAAVSRFVKAVLQDLPEATCLTMLDVSAAQSTSAALFSAGTDSDIVLDSRGLCPTLNESQSLVPVVKFSEEWVESVLLHVIVSSSETRVVFLAVHDALIITMHRGLQELRDKISFTLADRLLDILTPSSASGWLEGTEAVEGIEFGSPILCRRLAWVMYCLRGVHHRAATSYEVNSCSALFLRTFLIIADLPSETIKTRLFAELASILLDSSLLRDSKCLIKDTSQNLSSIVPSSSSYHAVISLAKPNYLVHLISEGAVLGKLRSTSENDATGARFIAATSQVVLAALQSAVPLKCSINSLVAYTYALRERAASLDAVSGALAGAMDGSAGAFDIHAEVLDRANGTITLDLIDLIGAHVEQGGEVVGMQSNSASGTDTSSRAPAGETFQDLNRSAQLRAFIAMSAVGVCGDGAPPALSTYPGGIESQLLGGAIGDLSALLESDSDVIGGTECSTLQRLHNRLQLLCAQFKVLETVFFDTGDDASVDVGKKTKQQPRRCRSGNKAGSMDISGGESGGMTKDISRAAAIVRSPAFRKLARQLDALATEATELVIDLVENFALRVLQKFARCVRWSISGRLGDLAQQSIVSLLECSSKVLLPRSPTESLFFGELSREPAQPPVSVAIVVAADVFDLLDTGEEDNESDNTGGGLEGRFGAVGGVGGDDGVSQGASTAKESLGARLDTLASRLILLIDAMHTLHEQDGFSSSRVYSRFSALLVDHVRPIGTISSAVQQHQHQQQHTGAQASSAGVPPRRKLLLRLLRDDFLAWRGCHEQVALIQRAAGVAAPGRLGGFALSSLDNAVAELAQQQQHALELAERLVSTAICDASSRESSAGMDEAITQSGRLHRFSGSAHIPTTPSNDALDTCVECLSLLREFEAVCLAGGANGDLPHNWISVLSSQLQQAIDRANSLMALENPATDPLVPPAGTRARAVIPARERLVAAAWMMEAAQDVPQLCDAPVDALLTGSGITASIEMKTRSILTRFQYNVRHDANADDAYALPETRGAEDTTGKDTKDASFRSDTVVVPEFDLLNFEGAVSESPVVPSIREERVTTAAAAASAAAEQGPGQVRLCNYLHRNGHRGMLGAIGENALFLPTNSSQVVGLFAADRGRSFGAASERLDHLARYKGAVSGSAKVGDLVSSSVGGRDREPRGSICSPFLLSSADLNGVLSSITDRYQCKMTRMPELHRFLSPATSSNDSHGTSIDGAKTVGQPSMSMSKLTQRDFDELAHAALLPETTESALYWQQLSGSADLLTVLGAFEVDVAHREVVLHFKLYNSAGFKIPFFTVSVLVQAADGAVGDGDGAQFLAATFDEHTPSAEAEGQEYFVPGAFIRRRFTVAIESLRAVDVVLRVHYPDLVYEDEYLFDAPGERGGGEAEHERLLNKKARRSGAQTFAPAYFFEHGFQQPGSRKWTASMDCLPLHIPVCAQLLPYGLSAFSISSSSSSSCSYSRSHPKSSNLNSRWLHRPSIPRHVFQDLWNRLLSPDYHAYGFGGSGGGGGCEMTVRVAGLLPFEEVEKKCCACSEERAGAVCDAVTRRVIAASCQPLLGAFVLGMACRVQLAPDILYIPDFATGEDFLAGRMAWSLQTMWGEEIAALLCVDAASPLDAPPDADTCCWFGTLSFRCSSEPCMRALLSDMPHCMFALSAGAFELLKM